MQIAESERREIVKALSGLLTVAKVAMPDSYYATDRRVKLAEKVVKKLEAMK